MSSTPSFISKLRTFLWDQHLPVGLVVMSIFGFLIPAPGLLLSKTPLNTISLLAIFFIGGLGLKTEDMKAAFGKSSIPSLLFGFISILAISPFLSFLFATDAFRNALGPIEFSSGMSLFAAMPTTVSSGIVMTTDAGGNAVIALLLSVGTNVLGAFTVPFFLSATMRPSDGSSLSETSKAKALDPIDLMWKMMVVIIIPLVVGKIVREYSVRVRDFVANYKSELKVTSSLFLISVPWMSMSAAADDIGRARFSDIVLLTIIGSVLHLVLLLFNYYSCDLLIKIPGLSIGLKEKKAVVISASQKTLNTAVSVIAFLPASLGDKGLITVPSIIAHCVQIIIDGFIVSWWKKQQLEQQQQQQQLPNEQQQEQQQQITNEKQQKVVIDGNNTNDSSRVNEIVVSESNLPVEAVEDSEVTQPPSGEGGSTTNNSNDDSWKNKGEVTLSGKL
jgi:solute carrier family 10 (sodium/bile acid cotransporter), member 7